MDSAMCRVLHVAWIKPDAPKKDISHAKSHPAPNSEPLPAIVLSLDRQSGLSALMMEGGSSVI